MSDASASISSHAAVSACAAMAVFYVAVLYAPTVVLRMRPPRSRDEFFLRRFFCAGVSTVVSVIATSALLRLDRLKDISKIFSVFGLRADHLWQALVIPLLLTSSIYAGSFVCKLGIFINNTNSIRIDYCVTKLLEGMGKCVRDIMSWRNFVVAPITEELVFRACIIPLLLCGGFKTYSIVFLSPIFFSLAHLNHFMELYFQGYSFSRAFLVVGLQLGYTVMFGWYAAFLFIRTGNLLSPIAAHIFCNIMGLPVLSAPHTKGMATFGFLAGTFCFFWFIFSATNPSLYNNYNKGIYQCKCWHGHCILSQ
ncbi:hypothetical protein LUZ60_013368 [Juncus effusus]|nr:hypothetical protein LUZ60_013368 [Juncus effusus]